MEEIRLNKYLSEQGVCSRREADRLIEAGKVTIDGRKAEMGEKVTGQETIICDGKPVGKAAGGKKVKPVLHGAAEDTTPEEQGMWAMFEVFVDTIVICTLTALVILCVERECALMAGGEEVWRIAAGLDGAALTSFCFTKILGSFGGFLVSASMAAFAFATIVGWYYIGRQMFSYLAEYLCPGANTEYLYTILYLLAVWLGCICRLELVWLVSDLVNGLMAYPNLLTLWLLAGHVQFPKIKTEK